MRITSITLSALALCAAAPALAQTDPVPGPENSPAQQGADQPAASQPIDSGDTAPPKPITLNSTITLVSDYRFRGLTQTGGNAAMQGSVTVGSSAGFYLSTWASTIDGRSGKTPALAGYGTEEVDLSGGFTKTFHGAGVDVGLLYYYYPAGRDGLNTDFFEPYASVSYTIGPVAAKVGAAYAWGGQKGLDFRPNNNDDNIYVYGEASLGIPTTPVTLKGHLGYTNGSLGLVNLYPNDDDYLDWSVTAEAVGGPFKVGVSYVDTDLSRRFGDYTVGTQNTRRDRFATAFGRGSTVLGYVGLSF